MADLGTQLTEKELNLIANRLQKIYREAQRDLKAKAKEHTAKYKAKDAEKRAAVQAGKLTKEEYKRWQQGQVFIGSQWKSKVEQMAQGLVNIEKTAVEIVRDGQMQAFADNANHTEYSIDQDTGFGMNFGLFDTRTVARLVKEQPELLRRRYVDGKACKAWNVRIISNCITQGILQGESVQKIADRMARDTASTDMKAMLRYARTAMTGAQNAGRQYAMEESAKQGISVKKVWLATLDDRTRDAHAQLDGQVVDVDKPFSSELGPIMYPGDPNAADANVWNCRCALGYEYPDSPSIGQRYDQEAGEAIGDMTYDEWERAKKAGLRTDYSNAKLNLFEQQKAVIAADAGHVFSGIWKNDVTYADYYDKLASIPAKRQYFQTQLDRAVALGDTANEAKFKHLMAELDLFKQNGANNWALLIQRDAAETAVKDLAKQFPAKERKQKLGGGPFDADAYTQARKDAALWAKSVQEADKALRDEAGRVWRDATAREKAAIYEYTLSYHKFNEPLRGIEYGTNRYLGVGNTDLNASYANNGDRLNAMTDIIEKSSYDRDVWLQRGCGYGGMDKFFQTTMDLLQYGTESELQKELLGREVTEYAFMSCGSAKGRGFSTHPIIMNIYCPKGTKMMYVEPFSHYGAEMHQSGWGEGLKWDGKKTQSSFGTELETILQQGTRCRVTKVERRGGGTIYFDIEVIAQDSPQRWTK